MVVYGDSAATAGAPVVPGLASSNVTVNITDAAGNAVGSAVMPDKIQVYVSSYALAVPLAGTSNVPHSCRNAARGSTCAAFAAGA
jgi:hypothetical protein